MNTICTTRLLVFALICGLSFPCAADIYTWVDADGVHHFSSSPPSDPRTQARLFIEAAPYIRPPADPVAPMIASTDHLAGSKAPPAEDDPLVETDAQPLVALEGASAPPSPAFPFETVETGTAAAHLHKRPPNHKRVTATRLGHLPNHADHRRRLQKRFTHTRRAGHKHHHRYRHPSGATPSGPSRRHYQGTRTVHPRWRPDSASAGSKPLMGSRQRQRPATASSFDRIQYGRMPMLVPPELRQHHSGQRLYRRTSPKRGGAQ